MMYIKMLCTEIRQPRSCRNQRPNALYHLKLPLICFFSYFHLTVEVCYCKCPKEPYGHVATFCVFLWFIHIFLISVVKAIVSNWSTYNMCTVYCVKLHWVGGGRVVRHILIFVIKESCAHHGYVRFSIFSYYIYLVVAWSTQWLWSTWCLQKDSGWLVIIHHQIVLSVYE